MSSGIIVGYDGSQCAQAALRAGLEVGRVYGETVTIAFGYELSPVGGEIHDYHLALRDLANQRLQEARDLAGAAAAEGDGDGPPIETIVVEREPAEALTALAEARDARAIVVGTRGERPLHGALIGSTPHKLLHLSKRPVLVVPTGYAAPTTPFLRDDVAVGADPADGGCSVLGMTASARAPAPGPAVVASALPGPYPVGVYAARLRDRLREFAHVQLTGEVWSVRVTRARVYFELRDGSGALPCAMWRTDLARLGLTLSDGLSVVVGGGVDLYPGSSTASPAFSFSVGELRIAGEGDLLAQLAVLRRRLDGEGLFRHQRALPRPPLPRTIGVVCAETGKARDDVRAGLARRGWGGRLVWGFAPVQDRRAAPAIAAALRELSACPEVEIVIVARGGGSLADLFAFCDESLCRTVALLRVPVIASVGHHTDHTLLDDVAAVSCSTPTHAAQAAVPVDLDAARTALADRAGRLTGHGRRAVLERARTLARLARGPSGHLARERERLRGLAAELERGARRDRADRRADTDRRAGALRRAAHRAADADAVIRRRELDRLALALAAHDPARTMARGYAMVTDGAGAPVTSAAGARGHERLDLRFRDGGLAVVPHADPDPEEEIQ